MRPLADLLRDHFGEDFPVGGGNAKRDDPLVITDERDHVSIEYGVAKLLLSRGGYEFEFEKQQTHNVNGRVVDELVYAAKPHGTADWTETRRFFFDVTAGFHKASQRDASNLSHRASEAPVSGGEMDATTKKAVQLWALAAQSGKVTKDQIAGAVYYGITDKPPPSEVVAIRDPVDLCDFLRREETGRSFTAAERSQLTDQIMGMAKAGGMPNHNFMRLLMWLPNFAILFAILVVIIQPFSWIVIGLAILGKVENGFARFLAGRAHQAAGFHVAVAIALILGSIVVSALHLFNVYRFP